eukprot:539884_1
MNDIYGKMINFTLENYLDIKNGLTQNGDDETKLQIIFDQLKYAKRLNDDIVNDTGSNQRKGHRWSSASIDWMCEILSKSPGLYSKLQKSTGLQMATVSNVKSKILKFRHVDMLHIGIVDEIKQQLVLHFGSMEEALKNKYDLSFDEITMGDDVNINMSNYAMEGRAAYLNSDNLLQDLRRKLYAVNNNIIDDISGSKYEMQLVIRSSTSNFVYYGPHFGSASGLSAPEIWSHVEDDFLFPLKVNLDIEISSIHIDLCSHHQQYILIRTGAKNLKELLGKPILIEIEFYDRNRW